MPSKTSGRAKASKAFGDTIYTNRHLPVAVLLNSRRSPEVVCQVQDHVGGFDDTIEVTLKQKQSGRRMTIVYQDDDPESEEADVVIKTTRAASRHRKGKSDKHQQADDSSSSSSFSSSSSSSSEEERIVEKKKAKKAKKTAKTKKARGSRKKSNKNGPRARDDKPTGVARETLAQAASITSLASIQSSVSLVPVPVAFFLQGSASSGRISAPAYLTARIHNVQPAIRPVSAPAPRRAREPEPEPEHEPEPEPTPCRPRTALGFARRFGTRAPWMRLLGARNEDKNIGPKSRGDRSTATSPTEILSSGESKSGSAMEDHRYCCYGCDMPRSEYWQEERRPRKGEKIKPSLCGSCRHKLRTAYNKVLGPRGEDLSTVYWCRACGFRRSSKFHRLHGEPSVSFSPLNNTCHMCSDDEERRTEIRKGKRRVIEEAEPVENCPADDVNTNETSPAGGHSAERTFSTGSGVWTTRNDSDPLLLRQNHGDKQKAEKQKADQHRPRSPCHRPTAADPETESIADDSRKAHQAEQTLRRSRASVAAASVIAPSDRTEVPTTSTVPISSREQTEQTEETRKTSDSSSYSKKSNGNSDTSRVPSGKQPKSVRQASGSSAGSKKNINTASSSYVTATSNVKSSNTGGSKYNTSAQPRNRTSAQPTSETNPAPESHDDFTAKPSKRTDSSSSSSGFCHNSSDSWARLNIDSTLREAFSMDPQELAARHARLMGMANEASPAPSVCVDGPRVWEVQSDEEA